MKVLQIASSLNDWGGIERYVSFLSKGLRDHGHEVTIARTDEGKLGKREPGVNIGIERKLDFRTLAKYLRLLSDTKFDVAHVHFSPDFVTAGLAVRMRKVPTRVMTRHVALPWNRRKARIYNRLWPNIIPVSNAVRNVLAESGIPPERMIVAKAGSPEPAFLRSRDEVRTDLSFGSTGFFAGSFSRLNKEKGIDVFLRAMPRAQGVHALIYGEGAYGEELAKLSSFMRVANQVHFIGRVEDVADHMRAMDVVVIPSVWEEAFPYAALEALAVGTPVIASNVGGIPEIVSEGETGFLFQAGNPEDLARALLDARSDPDRLAKIGQNGQELFHAEYTIPKMAARIEAAYLKFAELPA